MGLSILKMRHAPEAKHRQKYMGWHKDLTCLSDGVAQETSSKLRQRISVWQLTTLSKFIACLMFVWNNLLTGGKNAYLWTKCKVDNSMSSGRIAAWALNALSWMCYWTDRCVLELSAITCKRVQTYTCLTSIRTQNWTEKKYSGWVKILKFWNSIIKSSKIQILVRINTGNGTLKNQTPGRCGQNSICRKDKLC